MPRKHFAFGSGEAGAEAAQLQEVGQCKRIQRHGLSDAGRTDFRITSGIFTTIKVYNKIPLFLEYHLIRLGLLKKKEEVKILIHKLLDSHHLTHAAVRIYVLSDKHPEIKVLGYRTCVGEKTLVLSTAPLPKSPDFLSATTMQVEEKLPQKKWIQRSIYEKGQNFAKKCHVKEILFVSNDYFLESTIGNIISEDENGDLITPKLTDQGIKGISRQILLDRGYLKEKDIPTHTQKPLICINCLRVMGIHLFRAVHEDETGNLVKRVLNILKKEESNYEDSYYR